MKQTATDYLYDQFLKAFIEYVEEKIDGAKFSELMIEARVKSQIMEKQQIIEAYKHGQNNGYMYGMQKAIIIDSGQYYNETFNQ